LLKTKKGDEKMKKVFTILAVVVLTASVFAQAPQKMSYQAVIRDASDNLVTNQTVGIRISILEGSASGTLVYSETQTPETNDNGLLNIEFGGGIGFNTINWANGSYFIKTEIDLTGGSNYTITGTNQLLSVPYALYAENSASWRLNSDTIIYANKNYVHVKPPTGDATLMIEADPQNTNENDNPIIEFIQDGGYKASAIGLNLLSTTFNNGLFITNNSGLYSGIFFGIGNQPTGYTSLDSSNIKMMISPIGHVGIGTVNPDYQLTVDNILGDFSFKIGTPSDGIYMKMNHKGWVVTDTINNSTLSFQYYKPGSSADLTVNNEPTYTYFIPSDQGAGQHIVYSINGEKRFIVSGNGVTTVNSVMKLTPRNSAPSNPEKGMMYMDNSTNKLMVYDGTTWRACW
jgi:hypothetical protein